MYLRNCWHIWFVHLDEYKDETLLQVSWKAIYSYQIIKWKQKEIKLYIFILFRHWKELFNQDINIEIRGAQKNDTLGRLSSDHLFAETQIWTAMHG